MEKEDSTLDFYRFEIFRLKEENKKLRFALMHLMKLTHEELEIELERMQLEDE